MNTYQKILTGVVILLIIVNMILLGFIWRNRPGKGPRRDQPPRHEMQGHFFQRELDLNRDQAAMFREAFRDHQRKMFELNRQMRLLKREINRAIIIEDTSGLQMNYQKFYGLQKKVEVESSRFISSISAICNDEQKEKLLRIFDESIEKGRHQRNR